MSSNSIMKLSISVRSLRKSRIALPRRLKRAVTTFRSLRNKLMSAKLKVSFKSSTRKVRSKVNFFARGDNTT